MQSAAAGARSRASGVHPTRAETALILCGGLKPPPLAEAVGAPLFRLPYDGDRLVSRFWTESLREVGIPGERCYLLTNAEVGTSENGLPNPALPDGTAYRGPAGALRDAADRLKLDAPCVVIEGSRVFPSTRVLDELVRAHEPGQAVTIGANPDGSFAGVFVADPAAIELIPRIGYMDIKEQWLPAAARSGFRVTAHTLTEQSYSLRTLRGYLGAMRRMGRFEGPHTKGATVVGGDRRSLYGRHYGASVVYRTATVAPDAVTAHAVICDKAHIAGGAVVVRSVVGPGVRVTENQVIIDQILPATDEGNASSPSERDAGTA